MLGVLPVVFASDAIVAVDRLREVTIMIVFPLPLALVIGRGLLACLRGPGVARDIRARMIATVIVTVGYHFGTFQESARPADIRSCSSGRWGLGLTAKGPTGSPSGTPGIHYLW